MAESPAGFLICHKGCEVHIYIRILCLSLTPDPAWGLIYSGKERSRMLPNPRHDITSSSGPLHPICETGVRAYVQGFGVGGSCCKLGMEIV